MREMTFKPAGESACATNSCRLLPLVGQAVSPAWLLPELLLALTAITLLSACHFGRVNSGHVVEYYPQQGLLTVVDDSNCVLHVSVPQDAAEMGPVPTPGKLLRVDTAARTLTYFDQGLKTIPIRLIGQKQARTPGGTFPRIDRTRKTVTLYSPRDRMSITLSVPAQYLNLPNDTWRFGDEIRYYYKEPGRALRLMNVSQTDLASLQ